MVHPGIQPSEPTPSTFKSKLAPWGSCSPGPQAGPEHPSVGLKVCGTMLGSSRGLGLCSAGFFTGHPGLHQGLEGLPEGRQLGAQRAPASVHFSSVAIHVTHTGPGPERSHTPFGVVLCSVESWSRRAREACLVHIKNLMAPRAVGRQGALRIWPELDLQVGV